MPAPNRSCTRKRSKAEEAGQVPAGQRHRLPHLQVLGRPAHTGRREVLRLPQAVRARHAEGWWTSSPTRPRPTRSSPTPSSSTTPAGCTQRNADYAVETMKKLKPVGNSAMGAVGGFDEKRVQRIIDITTPIFAKQNSLQPTA